MRFQGQVAVIAGAGGGIARAAASRLSSEGATLILVDRDPEGLERACAEIAPAAGRMTYQVDCMSDEAVAACVADVLARQGRIDVLINAIGGSTLRPHQDGNADALSLDDWRALVDFNLVPTFLFCRHVAASMKARGRGKIVNLASISARGEGMSNVAYSAAKAGVVALTRRLSRELAPHGVYCNAVSPGLTLTDRIARHLDSLAPEKARKALEAVPLGRYAKPQEQASVIAFLASSDSDYVTGVTIDVTGGQ